MGYIIGIGSNSSPPCIRWILLRDKTNLHLLPCPLRIAKVESWKSFVSGILARPPRLTPFSFLFSECSRTCLLKVPPRLSYLVSLRADFVYQYRMYRTFFVIIASMMFLIIQGTLFLVIVKQTSLKYDGF